MTEITDVTIETADEVRYPNFDATECPFPGFAFLRAHEPVRKVPGRNHYMVTRYEDCSFVFKHPELFSNEDAYSAMETMDHLGASDAPTSLIETDPPAHKPKRQLCFQSFKPGRLKALEPHIYEIVDELIDGFIDRGVCNFTTEFARPIPTHVTCDIMGISREKRELLEEWGALEVGTPYLPEERVEWQRDIGQQVGAFLQEAFTERAANPRDDALSELIKNQIERDGDINLPYLMSEAAILIAGGVITTGHLLASAMVLLCENPDQMERVRSDHKKIPRMIEEAMRLECPAQWQTRRATQDVELGGTTIPANSLVMTLVGSANRDPSRFEDPDRFDVDRPNVIDHLAFGLGTHFCLGAPLARMEGRIAFERLLTRLSNIRLSERSDLSHIESPTFRAPKSVWIEFSRAN
jgi:cytochrome P450